MSIPKEPRQLMINIMYLVLLALLALNVSAKIFKAFEKVDHSLERTNEKLLTTNKVALAKAIEAGAKKDSKYDVYVDRIKPLRTMTQDFVDEVESIKEKLIDEGGNRDGEVTEEGDYIMKGGHLEMKGKKDKSVTTRLLVGDPNDENDGLGDELKKDIENMISQYGQFFDEEDKAKMDEYISLDISEDMDALEEEKEIKTWAQYNFSQMPIAATMPIFTKIQNDAISTENAILNYFNDKVGGKEIVLEKFAVVSSPEKTYVIAGEKFETEIFLSAAAGETSQAGITIQVNGSTVPTEEGIATWSQTANSTGIKTYKAAITVTNPVTGEANTYERQFEYEVGQRSVSVAADKMNVFYIGVENPITVSAAGVSSNDLRVSSAGSGGLSLSKTGKNSYIAKVSKPTGGDERAYVVVSGGGLQTTRAPFRVKRIPDPVALLGGQHDGGNIGNGTFKAQRGVIADLKDFDFEARCDISGFQLTRQSRNSDPIDVTNGGGSYGSDAKRLVNQAKPGDTYYFDNVRAKCPGDNITRKINQMVFKIK